MPAPENKETAVRSLVDSGLAFSRNSLTAWLDTFVPVSETDDYW